eukprot:m.307061 g.307061  ORF g.307061 m.307061 type:complete len:138 (-) comp19626_c0_seq2:350-763(-)
MHVEKCWGNDELALLNQATEAQRRFHEALCDDFDTPAATKESMGIFGLRLEPDISMAGWGAATVSSRQPPASNHQVEHLTQAVEHLTAFRDQIRVTARSLLKRDPSTAKQLFHYCDVVREELAGLEKPLDLRDRKAG